MQKMKLASKIYWIVLSTVWLILAIGYVGIMIGIEWPAEMWGIRAVEWNVVMGINLLVSLVALVVAEVVGRQAKDKQWQGWTRRCARWMPLCMIVWGLAKWMDLPVTKTLVVNIWGVGVLSVTVCTFLVGWITGGKRRWLNVMGVILLIVGFFYLELSKKVVDQWMDKLQVTFFPVKRDDLTEKSDNAFSDGQNALVEGAETEAEQMEDSDYYMEREGSDCAFVQPELETAAEVAEEMLSFCEKDQLSNCLDWEYRDFLCRIADDPEEDCGKSDLSYTFWSWVGYLMRNEWVSQTAKEKVAGILLDHLVQSPNFLRYYKEQRLDMLVALLDYAYNDLMEKASLEGDYDKFFKSAYALAEQGRQDKLIDNHWLQSESYCEKRGVSRNLAWGNKADKIYGFWIRRWADGNIKWIRGILDRVLNEYPNDLTKEKIDMYSELVKGNILYGLSDALSSKHREFRMFGHVFSDPASKIVDINLKECAEYLSWLRETGWFAEEYLTWAQERFRLWQEEVRRNADGQIAVYWDGCLRDNPWVPVWEKICSNYRSWDEGFEFITLADLKAVYRLSGKIRWVMGMTDKGRQIMKILPEPKKDSLQEKIEVLKKNVVLSGSIDISRDSAYRLFMERFRMNTIILAQDNKIMLSTDDLSGLDHLPCAKVRIFEDLKFIDIPDLSLSVCFERYGTVTLEYSPAGLLELQKRGDIEITPFVNEESKSFCYFVVYADGCVRIAKSFLDEQKQLLYYERFYYPELFFFWTV